MELQDLVYRGRETGEIKSLSWNPTVKDNVLIMGPFFMRLSSLLSPQSVKSLDALWSDPLVGQSHQLY